MRSFKRAALIGAACVVFARLSVGSALAAHRVPGGGYAGRAGSGGSRKFSFPPNRVAFNVDDAGRAFASDPKIYFEGSWIALPCATRAWDLGGSQRQNGDNDFETASDGTPVRIRRDGSFVLSAAITYRRVPRGLRLKLSGRFVRGGKRASGSVVVAAAPRVRPKCARRGSFSARFTGQRHLAEGSCTPAMTKTIADDGVRRVYEERYVEDPAIGGHTSDVAYGCDRRTNSRWFLAGIDSTNDYLDAFATSESFLNAWLQEELVAMWVNDCGGAGCAPLIRFVDLRDGTRRFETGAGAGDLLEAEVESLVLKGNGSAAWTLCESRSGGPYCNVVKEEAFGSAVLLDKGRIDGRSLSLVGSTLSWTNGGMTMRATLN